MRARDLLPRSGRNTIDTIEMSGKLLYQLATNILENQKTRKSKARVQHIQRDCQKIRSALNLSQHDTARLLNLNKRSWQNWEQGRSLPSSATRSLIKLTSKHPELVIRAINDYDSA